MMQGQPIVTSPLHGLRILIVEDETLIAMLLEDYLTEFGCIVVASARKIQPAIDALAHEKIDAAILDLNVAGENVSLVMEALSAKNIPFIFASGFGTTAVPEQWAARPKLHKPYTSEELREALIAAIEP